MDLWYNVREGQRKMYVYADFSGICPEHILRNRPEGAACAGLRVYDGTTVGRQFCLITL